MSDSDHVSSRDDAQREWERSATIEQINYMRHLARVSSAIVSAAGGFQDNQAECPHPQLEYSALARILRERTGVECPRCHFLTWSNWFAIVDASSWNER